MDGGCTAHICGERKQFIRYMGFGKSEEREISDFAGRVAGKAVGYGDVRLRLQQPGRRRTSKVVVVRNVLHVEGARNTLSQSMLMDRGLRIVPVNSYGLRIPQQRPVIDDTGLESLSAWHGRLVGYSSLTLLVQEQVLGTPQVGLGRSRVQEV